MAAPWLGPSGFTDTNLSDLDGAEFVGLHDYVHLLQNPDCRSAVWNTLVFAFASVTLETPLGVALVLDAHCRRGLVRAAVLISQAIPTPASAQSRGATSLRPR